MRHLLMGFILLVGCIGSANSQNTLGTNDDMGRIALSPVVAEEWGVPVYAQKALTSKLKQIVVRNGLATESLSPRFVLTASVDLLDKQMTSTAPPMTAVELSPILYIGDAVTGQLFATYAYESCKGVGTNENRAYMAALNGIKTTSADVAAFIEQGKQKIIEFYNTQIDLLLTEAKALADQSRHDEAIALLSGVPSVCKEAYVKAMSEVATMYQRKIDVEGAAAYNQAFAAWKTNKSREGAEAAATHLADIHPMSSYAAKGLDLVKSIESHYASIEARRRAMEERAYQYRLQREADEREFQREKMHLDHDVAMKRSENSVSFGQLALQEMSKNKNVALSSSTTIVSQSKGGLANKVSSWFK